MSLPRDGSTIYIVSAHNTMLSSNDKDVVSFSPNRQAWEEWTIHHLGGGKYHIRSKQWKKYLRSQADKFVNTTDKAQAWEEWYFTKQDKGFLISSVAHGLQLRAGDDKTAGTTQNKQAWEVFTAEVINGGAPGHGAHGYIVSAHNTMLSSNDKDAVSFSPNRQAWEEWHISSCGGGKFHIKSKQWGKYLRSQADKFVNTIDKPQQWEEWIFTPQDKGFLITSATHGLQLRAGDDKTAGTSQNKQAWEVFHFEPIGDHHDYKHAGGGGLQFGVKYFFKSAHGNYLSSNGDGVTSLSNNTQAWEQFTIRSAGGSHVFITSAEFKKNLGAKQDGEFQATYTHSNEQDWEKWTVLSDGKGGYHFKNHHGKHLRAGDKGEVNCHSNKKEWETWTLVNV